MALDEIHLILVILEDLIGDGDRLEDQHAVILKKLAATGEEILIIMVTNRLDHLNGDNPVELAGKIAIIFE